MIFDMNFIYVFLLEYRVSIIYRFICYYMIIWLVISYISHIYNHYYIRGVMGHVLCTYYYDDNVD